jgi:hypothetical protein
MESFCSFPRQNYNETQSSAGRELLIEDQYQEGLLEEEECSNSYSMNTEQSEALCAESVNVEGIKLNTGNEWWDHDQDLAQRDQSYMKNRKYIETPYQDDQLQSRQRSLLASGW